MFGEKNLSACVLACETHSTSHAKITQQQQQQQQQDHLSMDFLKETKMGLQRFDSEENSRTRNSSSQELTLRSLCENSKVGFLQKQDFNRMDLKGKDTIVSASLNHGEDKWVERDFLNLNESVQLSSKRAAVSEQEQEEEVERRKKAEKKPRVETLNLSLALPDVSLSLTASNALQNADPDPDPDPDSQAKDSTKSSRGIAPTSTHNTQTTCSNDFTAQSMSLSYTYSYSHPLSHNPSCSLTRNSTENCEHSVCKEDQIWYAGEGTNGSVHSRFKPIGDGGVALANASNTNVNACHGGGCGSSSFMMQNSKDLSSSFYRTASSDNHSFFPSELPARARKDAVSGDSKGRNSDHVRELDGGVGGRARKLSRPERLLREIVSGSIPEVAQIVQQLPEGALESAKEYLQSLIDKPERRHELVNLQNRLEKRSDLTKETLSKCQKDQLGILVSIKFGIGSFLLSGKNRVPSLELIEIFMYTRCRNVNCKSILPVDDCECKICSKNKGFCSSCMCPVCLKFDCASNTCSWVGCDVCSHWCHAACGIQKNLIYPGPSLKGPSGITEMQFHCIGCDHASEMFGFVKDVFSYCPRDWQLETLKKELDCVRSIFRRSEDHKGKQLHDKAEELLSKLDRNMMSPLDACDVIIRFFNDIESMANFPVPGASSKDKVATSSSRGKDVPSTLARHSSPPKYSIYNIGSSDIPRDFSDDFHTRDLKAPLPRESKTSGDLERLAMADAFESIGSLIRIKDAEARMFQTKADEARRDAEGYKQMIRAKMEKLDEEYSQKIGQLCVQEAEEQRRKKLEELKVLENAHCDYQKMKLRMQAEIAGLLERMDATRQQWL